ncbi:MAG TPA: ABC transporter substrate binding protein, partial [Elusimicrobiales bacterium]|nr:ABC transporter substrate binding protein [Elusimicrobiales bacterium]
PEKEKQILERFRKEKPDLVLVFPTGASVRAKQQLAGSGIPIVFADAHIEGAELVQSIKEPGGNITGVRYPGPDLAIKRFELMLDIKPGVKRLVVPYLSGYPSVPAQLLALRSAASKSGVKLVELPVSSAARLNLELRWLEGKFSPNADALLCLAEPLSVSSSTLSTLGAFAARHRLPMGGGFMMCAGENCPIFALTTDSKAVGRQAALMADKIFRGARPGSIPVYSGDVVLLVNYRAARAAGLNLSEGLLSKADEVLR